MSENKTLADRLMFKIKNNRVIAVLIVIGVTTIGFSRFTDAAKNLQNLLTEDVRPPINGVWSAEVTYDWENATYTEKFEFKGDGHQLYGTASFLNTPRGILQGEINNQQLEFTTKTRAVADHTDGGEYREESKSVTHHYQGIVSGDKIHFSMQADGGFSSHVPVEFIAKKVTEESAFAND